MAMGIVSDEQLEREIKNTHVPLISDVKTGTVINPTEKGRKEGDNNVPSALREIISETAQLEGRKDALEFANHFGISPSSVSAYTAERTSTSANKKDARITNHVNKSKAIIRGKAKRVLKQALDNITDEKLTDTKAVELASIAKSMSSIVKEMEPNNINEEDQKKGPSIIIYAPQIRNENSFEFIQASE